MIALSVVAQVLARAVLDAALALDRPLVVDVDVVAHAGVGLGLLLGDVEAVVVLAADPRPVVGQLVELQALLAHLLLVDRLAKLVKNEYQ